MKKINIPALPQCLSSLKLLLSKVILVLPQDFFTGRVIRLLMKMLHNFEAIVMLAFTN